MEPTTEVLIGEAGAVEVTRPPRRPGTRHARFIADHWPSLAAAAYAGFQQHGAGAVVLFGEEGNGAPRLLRRFGKERPLAVQRIWYATVLGAIPGMPADWGRTWEAEQVETYDPARQGVLVFVEGTGRRREVRGFLVGGMLKPPEAYRQARAPLN
ncbi:MAG: hypothetical protein R3362_03065 [Rhodothermales bacterium]|nr:hypothetical protein [Rhodothermales bacterium]